MDREELLRIIKKASDTRSALLDLSRKDIAELPPEIGKLKNVQELNLEDNQLKALPPEIRALTNLRTLQLWQNQLTSLPPEIGALANLQELHLYSNQLTSLPPEIRALTNLGTLDLADNRLTSLAPEICQLTNLGTLELEWNQLTSLPPEVGELTSLRILNLWDNQLTYLPPEIGRLTKLRELIVANNALTSLPAEIGHLTNLKGLDLRGNQLRQLPESFLELSLDFNTKELQDVPGTPSGISVAGNPLERPPLEIIEQGREAVRRYFASLREKARVLNEVKVILVGDGGAGKTSLVKRLLRDEFDDKEPQTHGVNIDDWTVTISGTKICAHLWDFGGQVIMHSTRQFFLSRRSLYILVLDGRKEEDAEYWLKHIESFGGDSPILVVLNKMDENPGFDVNRRFLQAKYKGIQGYFRVSCKSSTGIGPLKKAIINSLAEVEITSTAWPERWFRAKERLEKMTCSFISEDDYAEIRKKERIPDEADQDTLVRFLHDLGVIVHFHDFGLRHMHVLNPRWLTTAVYRIINSEILAKNKGILKLSCLADILSAKGDDFAYPAVQHPYIVNIMEKFELCFRIDRNRILIPDLLKVQEPEMDFNYDSSLRFRIDYDFLPKSVIPRLIVKKHAEIRGGLRWRTGVALESKVFKATAVVRADVAAKKIYIFVAGPQRRDYLTVLRSIFLEINKGFEKLEYTERIPLPDDPQVTVGFQYLLQLEQDGVEEFRPEGAKRRYRVKELLGTIYIERKPTADAFFRMLQQLVKDSDQEKAIVEKANGIMMLQPNFMGLGINLNTLVDRFLKRRKSRAKR